MSRQRKSCSFLVAATLGVLAGIAANKPHETSDVEGRALAEELRSLKPEENLEVSGFIRIRKSTGERARVPFRYQILVGPAGWQSSYETLPSNQAPPEKFVIVHSDQQPNRYLVTRTAPQGTQPGPVSLSGDQAMVPFANSDFWLADLGLEFLHWPEQRIVEEARIKMRKSRPCKVLESANPRPGAAGYTRVRSWVDAATGGIIIAEAYGPDGRLLKEFEVGSLTKVNGQWELKNLEMRDVQADSQTVLEFKYDQKTGK
jgi:hypothetical protein